LAKKEQRKPKREVTKRQLSLWQRQKRRQRFILGLGILIIAATLVTIGAGWYTTQYRPLHETVITVNDTSLDMDYYVKALKYYGQGQPSYYIYTLADYVVTIIEQNELIRQGAEELGISVSNDEVDEELNSRDPPLSKDYRDLVRAEMLITKLGDEYFEHQVPESTEQRHILAMFLESESQAMEVTARLEASEDFDNDFAELAGELSLEGISEVNKGDLGWRPKGVLTALLYTPVVDDYAFSGEVGVLSQPIYDEARTKSIGYWLIEVLERREDTGEAHVQAILLGSEEEAQAIRDRLEAGEDFAELATEFSQHEESKENGGDLGWLTSDTMTSAFDEFAFDSEVKLETLSEPIGDDTMVTEGGYWLVKVLDKDDNREIEDDDRAVLKAEALNEWVSSLWDDPETKIESYLDEEKMSWAISKAIGELEE
jgi:parvulin-like peptidyl-prolyl isomerase